MNTILQDTRYAWRALARSPGFALTVVLTFALGIGLNTASFSVLDRVYLRPPDGVADPAGVRRIWFESSRFEGGQRQAFESHPYPMLRIVAEASGDPSSLTIVTNQSARLGGTLRGVDTDLTFASANYFSVLGVRPGVYGTISYTVGQRMHEFGVRVALGARVRDVLTLVVGEGLRVIGIGVLLGIALVVAAGRLIEALLYGVEPSNPAVILTASAALLVAAGVAALLPAWRGARADPCIALRDS